MSPRDLRLSEHLSLLKTGNRRVRTFLTLSATTQQSALEQAIDHQDLNQLGISLLQSAPNALTGRRRNRNIYKM